MANLFTNLRQRLGAAISGTAISGTTVAQLQPRAGGSQPYDAGGTGRRAQGWMPTRLGPTTILWGNLEQVRARSHDQVRNNAHARAAVDKFESNVVGTGIQPHFQHPDPKIKELLQRVWNQSVPEIDFAGQSDFYGLQGLVAREIFEGGEVFIRYRLRPSTDNLTVPIQLQLLEGEQVPVFLNIMPPTAGGINIVRTGIEFDTDGKRIAYHMWKEHPGETMFYPLDALTYIRVPASEILHVMKPLRAGQLRGEPHLTPVLSLLYELDQYQDAELVRKKVAAMFAGFITKPSPEDQIIPPAPQVPQNPSIEDPLNPTSFVNPDIGTDVGKLEPGTLQMLLPGEEITFPKVPNTGDYSAFISVNLHKFASGIGMTYEQLTGDLRGVNYSSIRAGLLEFRRACEQFQFNVMVTQFCNPFLRRWMKEAVISGALRQIRSQYLADPTAFQDVVWVAPGWQWVDPQKEMQAYLQAVRAGFTSRTMVVREQGMDPAVIDAQQSEERARAQQLGITYDSDPNKVLIGRETQPQLTGPTGSTPDQEAEEDQDQDQSTVAFGNPNDRLPEKVQ